MTGAYQTEQTKRNATSGQRARPRILFVTLKNFVGSDRLVAALAQNGGECAVLGWPLNDCARSQFVSRRFFLPPDLLIGFGVPFLRSRMAAAIKTWRPDLIIPVDDAAARALRLIALTNDVSAVLRDLLTRSLGQPAGYAASYTRGALMDRAERLNLRAPKTRAVTGLAGALGAAQDLGYPVVLKRDATSAGSGVNIAATPDELERAFRANRRRVTGLSAKAIVRAARRMIASLAGIPSLYADSMTLQKHVSGRLAMCTALAHEGRALEVASFEAIEINPKPTGPSTVIRPIANPEIEVTARKIIEDLGCSGLVSFDFIVDEAGHAHLIEMNPRPIPSTHLGRLAGADLCAGLISSLRAEEPNKSVVECRNDLTIALFPRELERNPRSPYVWGAGQNVLHDVPWTDEPILRLHRMRIERANPALRHDLEALLRRAGGEENRAIPV